MKAYSVSIITPVFNEEEIIESTIIKNIEILKKSNINFEIITIDDASVDQSLSILQQLSQTFPIKIIQHDENKGFGAAIKSGIQLAKNDYLVCLPVDNPLDDELFYSFQSNFGKADVLISYRRKRIGYTLRMKINSTVYHFLISKIFKIQLKDFNWIHAYHHKVFIENKFNLEYNSIFMLAEVLIKAKKHQYSFIEFPVNQTKRVTGTASSTKLRTILKTLFDLIHYYTLKHFK